MAPPPRACPRCGSPAAAYQQTCIDCGAPLSRRALPGGWLWPAAAMLAVAAVAAAVAVAIGKDGGRGPIVAPPLTTAAATTQPPPATAPSARAGTTPGSDAATTQAASTAAATTARPGATSAPATTMSAAATTGTGAATTAATTTAATTAAAATPTAGTWPAGRDGFTVVLASLPRAQGLARARARAAEAARRGLPQAGVLVSDGFASLHPGYLVVFSGVYSTLAQAQQAARAAQGVFPGAYPRRVQR